MRELHDHKTNGCNEALKIEAIVDPGPGGASHLYEITGFDTGTNPSMYGITREGAPKGSLLIPFQNGPIPEKGVNGITSEALLAILIDRHRGFASGPYPSRDNSIALTHMEDALLRLQNRTNDRIRRGVEGKMEK